MAQRASEWTEQVKNLIPQDELVRIRQSMIDAKTLDNDLETVAAVTPAAFKDALIKVQQSMQANEQAARESKEPIAPKPAPQAQAQNVFEDEDIAMLRHELGVHVARSGRRSETQALALTSMATLLESIASQVAALSEQVAAGQRASNERLVTIEQSMKRPTAPKTVAGQLTGARPVPGPNDEPPARATERAAFDRDLKREINVARSRLQQATNDGERAAARERFKQLSAASTAVTSYPGDFDALRSEFSISNAAG